MKILIDLEDTFGDIVRKAAKGTGSSPQSLASAASVDGAALQAFLADEAHPSAQQAASLANALGLDGTKLADIALGRWKPQEREQPAYIDHQVNRPHPSNGYFIIEKAPAEAAFVDPGGNCENIIATLQRSSATLRYILLTHKHPDHIDALAGLRRAFPHAQVVIHRLDARALGRTGEGALSVDDGHTLPFAGGDIRLVHTPGHTDGSSCFVYKDSIFTGDTLFAGSVGGLFGDDFGYDDLLRNVRTRILPLPENTVVLPGHGPPSTIAEERGHNPFFTT